MAWATGGAPGALRDDLPDEPDAEQVEAFRRDGFLVLERWLEPARLDELRDRFARCFAHEWETGLAPDEVNYVPGQTPPDRTRQLCNVWKSDRVLAATVLDRRVGRFAARLAGVPGMRLAQDNAIWKPPAGLALEAHQDAAHCEWLEPPNMTTCWMALDDTHADTGTIYYLRGSHRWGRFGTGSSFHAPDDWLGHARRLLPPGEELELVPIEVPAGGVAFHDGWCFHGSPPNERTDRGRRALISHLIRADSRWGTGVNRVYSRYRRPGEEELDPAFFPIVWAEDRG